MKNLFWPGYLIIIVISGICYFPSILHIPRADHIAYLAEVAQQKDLYSLAIRSADIPRTRLFIPGDQVLFRPVTFSFQGLEKYCFGYNFMYWQITGIILHFCVLFFLLKLLINLRPGIFAFVLTSFFSVLFIPMEMVIWEEINGYMIFVIAILIALDQLYSYINKKDDRSWRLIVICVALLVACFTYETSSLLVFLVLIYFWMNSPQKRKTLANLLMIIAPVFIYIFFDIWDWCSHQGLSLVLPNQAGGTNPFNLIYNSFVNLCIAGLSWFTVGLAPAQFGFQLTNGGRSILAVDRSFQCINVISGAVLILFLLIPKLKAKNYFLLKWNFSILLAGIVFVYTFLIAVGRMNSKGWQDLTLNVYYAYIFWAFLLPLAYSIVDFDRLKRTLIYRFKWAILFVLLLLTAFSGYQVFFINCRIASISRESRDLVHQIEIFKKAHQTETDFSFYVPDTYPGNYVVTWLNKKGDAPDKKYSLIEALYLDCFKKDNPKYAIN